jgi:prepilin-type N-terminal cleavage/methylation domain-containing protein
MLHFITKKSNYQQDRGYTLLEMLAVVGLLGIMVAIATPSVLAMMATARLSNSLEVLRDTIELSRIKTTQKTQKCRVYIPNGNQIISDCIVAADHTSAGITGVPNGLPLVKLDDDVTMKNSDSTLTSFNITYNFRGITLNSGTIVLSSVSNPDGEKRCLTLTSGVGLIGTGKYISGTCQVGG